MNESSCTRICDLIAADDADMPMLLDAYMTARDADPTFSSHAAHILDAIRDNIAPDAIARDILNLLDMLARMTQRDDIARILHDLDQIYDDLD